MEWKSNTPKGTIRVFAVGEGKRYVLGTDSEENVTTPTDLDGKLFNDEEVVSISTGHVHTLTLTKEGHVYSWGEGVDGQLGHGDHEVRRIPTMIQFFSDIKIVKICCGASWSLALSEEGTLYSWGQGMFCGHGNPTSIILPQPIDFSWNDKAIEEVVAGYRLTAVRNSGGEIFIFGQRFGGLGASTDEEDVRTPKMIDFPGLREEQVTKMSLGKDHILVISKEGSSLLVWGSNADGRAGCGKSEGIRWNPKRVRLYGVDGVNSDVTCGYTHSLLLSSKGFIYSTGRELHGKLGRTTSSTASYNFGKVVLMNTNGEDFNVKHICCGENASYAIDVSGSLWSWGDNMKGQLGHTSGSLCIRKPDAVTEYSIKVTEVVDVVSCGDHAFILARSIEIL